MIIENEAIKSNEKNWLEKILSVDFRHKEEIVNQINNSVIEREYTDFYLSLKFKVNKIIKPIETNIRVPVEMRVYKANQVPIQFLLHIIQGYVSELEIFNADSSIIDKNISFTDSKLEIIIY